MQRLKRHGPNDVQRAQKCGASCWRNSLKKRRADTILERAELAGVRLDELPNGPGLAGSMPAIRVQLVRDGQWLGELPRRAKDGAARMDRVHIKLLRDEWGLPTHVVYNIEDVTGEKQAQR